MKLNRMIAMMMAVMLMMLGTAALAQGTLTVKGVGVVSVNSDRAGINLGVRETDTEVMVAQAKVNEKIGKIVDAMKAMGVEADAISTNGIGIYPNYDYEEVETVTSYTAYNNIYLMVKDVNNTGAYIDAAFAAGANSLDYVEFSAVETAEAADQAMAMAVSSAQEKARVLAEAAGVKLGAILEIREGGDNSYDSGMLLAKNVEADTGDGTEVMAAKQTVYAEVNVTFALDE